jgi:hypothetical protein
MRSLFVRAAMLVGRREWHGVERLAEHPGAAQERVLHDILTANRDTRFGVEHGFRDIRTLAEFRARVPVQTYESLHPYIDEQRRTGAPTLTAEPPAFYAQTSGTSGTPKYIPVTPSMLARHRSEQRLFSYLQYRACPEAFVGSALGIMGAAVEARLDSGHVVGSVSGHLYQALPRVVRSRFVIPPEVMGIADYGLKYLVLLRLALSERNVTYLGSPNPTTFVRLLDVANERRDELIQSIEDGRLEALSALDPALRRSIGQRLRPDPARARELRRHSRLTFANVWPAIRLVTTWTSGSCGIPLGKVRKTLPPAALVMELGYQSTECRGTIALEAETAAGLPPPHHHVIEFVEQASWDRGAPEFLGLEELERGRRYYVLFTTAAGLYRYFMNDLVDVDDLFRRTPLLRFVQKGKGVTSLTGEKLYEAQAIEAVRSVSDRSGLVSTFFILVAEEETSAYTLFIEADGRGSLDASAVAAAIDRRLCELNIEYETKRKSGRLGPLAVSWLAAGTAEAYKVACIRAGQRESQFKPPALQYRKDVTLRFEDHVTA